MSRPNSNLTGNRLPLPRRETTVILSDDESEYDEHSEGTERLTDDESDYEDEYSEGTKQLIDDESEYEDEYSGETGLNVYRVPIGHRDTYPVLTRPRARAGYQLGEDWLPHDEEIEYGVTPIQRFRLNTREVIRKRYTHDTIYINQYAINESSVLQFLNDRDVDSAPTFYKTLIREEGGLVITESLHQGAGYSIREWTQNMDFDRTCNFILERIEVIVQDLTDIHRDGVVHNNPTVDNIWIDGEDQVQLTNFDLATYVGQIDQTHPSRQYIVPGRYPDSPSTPADDIWLLGIHLLNLCIEKYGDSNVRPIPVFGDRIHEWPAHITGSNGQSISGEEWNQFNRRLEETSWKIKTTSILPRHLRDAINKLIRFKPDQRVASVRVSNIIPQYDISNANKTVRYATPVWYTFRNYITFVKEGLSHGIPSSSTAIITGLDLIRRCVDMNLNGVDEESLALTTYVLTNKFTDYQALTDMITRMRNSRRITVRLRTLTHLTDQVFKFLNGRIHTPDNSTVITTGISAERLIRMIEDAKYEILNATLSTIKMSLANTV